MSVPRAISHNLCLDWINPEESQGNPTAGFSESDQIVIDFPVSTICWLYHWEFGINTAKTCAEYMSEIKICARMWTCKKNSTENSESIQDHS